MTTALSPTPDSSCRSPLANRLGLGDLTDECLDLGAKPGRANPGEKLMALVASALVGGDCIDDADVLRAGETEKMLGFKVKAPSTLGTFLRSFPLGTRALSWTG